MLDFLLQNDHISINSLACWWSLVWMLLCVAMKRRRGGSNKPLSTGRPSTHKGIPLGEVLHISAHIPPLLFPETWMIWLFYDSLFLKSVSAPYVSNIRLARHMNALPWGLREARAVFKPGGRIGFVNSDRHTRCANVHRTGFKCMLKKMPFYCYASQVRPVSLFFFFFALWINNAA